jgi:hypothetical protein
VNVKCGKPQNRMKDKERKWKDYDVLYLLKKSHAYTWWKTVRKENPDYRRKNKQLQEMTA